MKCQDCKKNKLMALAALGIMCVSTILYVQARRGGRREGEQKIVYCKDCEKKIKNR